MRSIVIVVVVLSILAIVAYFVLNDSSSRENER